MTITEAERDELQNLIQHAITTEGARVRAWERFDRCPPSDIREALRRVHDDKAQDANEAHRLVNQYVDELMTPAATYVPRRIDRARLIELHRPM